MSDTDKVTAQDVRERYAKASRQLWMLYDQRLSDKGISDFEAACKEEKSWGDVLDCVKAGGDPIICVLARQ